MCVVLIVHIFIRFENSFYLIAEVVLVVLLILVVLVVRVPAVRPVNSSQSTVESDDLGDSFP